ncbi:hypothetical protein [Actinomadura decatromicini]|uniref:Uncharacterized protein n=1 Tax=Actinomadura decatromicini TaxID=2604572 RepID=A0A5D3FXR2_9ACTN|nr:hypothetical protein [Actinomadura decatromicini]TYK53023.1 hypothetical protein FXF68_04610 [Actinomadura decatromicini]
MTMEEPWGNSQIVRIIERLLKRTKAGSVEWNVIVPRSAGRRGRDGFGYSTSSASVIIGSVDGDGRPPFYFEIMDDEGVSIERFYMPPDRRSARAREEIDAAILSDEDNAVKRLYVSMELLYNLARRNALKSDQVLDQLERDLEDG